MADPAPYSADLTLTVTVTAPPPPQRFRHFYRFLLPKTCGNLAYFGPGEAKPLPPPPPVSCTKSVEVGQCAGDLGHCSWALDGHLPHHELGAGPLSAGVDLDVALCRTVRAADQSDPQRNHR